MPSFYDEVSKNKRNSLLLAAVVFAVLGALVYIIGYLLFPEDMFAFLVIAAISSSLYIYGTFNYGDNILLSYTKAKPATMPMHAHLINAVEGLSIAAGIPKPKIYVMESDEINAFATGKSPDKASIVVTTGALNNLKRDELEGVMGHEISHIKNYDVRFATVVAVMVGLIAILSYMFLRMSRYSLSDRRDKSGMVVILLVVGLVLAIFSPFIVRLVQFAVSRKREFLADASSAQLTRYPDGLANALERIKKQNKGNMQVSEAVSHLFFTDPTKSALDSLYATHPSIDERIKRLREM